MNEEGDRDKIRQALLDYMQRNNIGVGNLAKHIGQKTGFAIPPKTLQRFLAGHMRTNDAMVSWCAKFVEKLDKVDLTGTFARAARAFYAAPILENSVGYKAIWSSGIEQVESVFTISGSLVSEVSEVTGRKRVFHGTIVWSNAVALVVLKELLTLAPKAYLVRNRDGMLEAGSGLYSDPLEPYGADSLTTEVEFHPNV